MTLRLIEHPAALDELIDAAEYYEGQRPGLADYFEAEIDRTLADIQWNPDAWAKFPGWNRLPVVRSHTVHIFPYRVVYFVHNDELAVVAYAHQRRKPGYWKSRVSDLA